MKFYLTALCLFSIHAYGATRDCTANAPSRLGGTILVRAVVTSQLLTNKILSVDLSLAAGPFQRLVCDTNSAITVCKSATPTELDLVVFHPLFGPSVQLKDAASEVFRCKKR